MGGDVISAHSLDQDDSLYWRPPALQWGWGTEQVLGGKAPGCRGARWLGERDGELGRSMEGSVRNPPPGALLGHLLTG